MTDLGGGWKWREESERWQKKKNRKQCRLPILPTLRTVFWGPIQALVSQSCPTLCNPMNCSPPGSSVHGILQARILEWVDSLSLLQGIFLMQRWNLGLPTRLLCPWILQARILEWVDSLSLLQGIFLMQRWNLGLLHCRQILYHLSH